jgi:hypothetical protein
MPRSVYEVLSEGLLEIDEYFLQKQDALGKLGASTDQKMVCELRQLVYGVPADRSRGSCFPSAGESGQCRALRRTGHDEFICGTHQLIAASRESAILSSARKCVFIWHRNKHLANGTSSILRQNSALSFWVGIPKRKKVDPQIYFLRHVRPPTNLLRWCRVKRFR